VSVRPEFGPTLPALLQARGVSRRAMGIGAVVLVALAVAAVLVVRASRDQAGLVVHGPPSFNLVYPPSIMHEAPLHDGELARLEGSRRNGTVAITARAVHLPPYPNGDVVGGYLPILAEQRIAELRARYGPVEIFDEGKARINLFPGYQIGFAARTGSTRVFGRDTYVFPKEGEVRDGVLLSLRRTVRRKPTAADNDFYKAAKAVFTSFAFGEGRP
jgi:hypothetical protein